MILIYRELGFIAFPIACLSIFGPALASVFLVEQYPNLSVKTVLAGFEATGLLIGGSTCWYLGRRFNRGLKWSETHSLYFIRLEYWGAFLILLSFAVASLWLAWILGVIKR